jgi:hypothetical protein
MPSHKKCRTNGLLTQVAEVTDILYHRQFVTLTAHKVDNMSVRQRHVRHFVVS